MQMILTTETADYAAWKPRLDADAVDRMEAGLTLLQMWRDADARERVVMLFEVNDRARAQAWVAKESALGAPMRAQFLEFA